ncbi:MAG TPA: type II secretion system F family protein [Candidatus Paceibacterota bacterium]|nr:type II secretion system F family protein [Candidatus Paceibacterota bacterium]
MLYRYTAINQETNDEKEGTIEAANLDVAIASLQRRKLVIVTIVAADKQPLWQKMFVVGKKVPYRDVVILSRQVATLFRAQVSALRVFQLLSTETEDQMLRKKLDEIAEDIQGGMPLSNALGKHPEVFSDFYVNMVKAGEESGNLSNTFQFLADYLERSYELVGKIRNALIYPVLVITVFIAVMVLMLVMVVPKLAAIILETGKQPPIYTQITIGMSNFLVEYGFLLLAILVSIVIAIWRFANTLQGKEFFARAAIEVPFAGDLFRKFYLARVADNLHTMLSSGIAMVRAVEVAASVVGNEVYSTTLNQVAIDIRTGSSLSASMARHEVIPTIMSQMVRVGEETGEVGSILETLARFYKREVDQAVDTLIGLIEPALIILLGVGVGGLLTSVLLPIYEITATF